MLRLLTTSFPINRVGCIRHLSAKVNCKEQLSKITDDISNLKTQIETLRSTLNTSEESNKKEKEKLKVNDKPKNDKPNISVYISPSTYLGEPSVIVEKNNRFTGGVSTRIIPQSQIGSHRNYPILSAYFQSEDAKNNKNIADIHKMVKEQYQKKLEIFNNKRSFGDAVVTMSFSTGFVAYSAFMYQAFMLYVDDFSMIYCSSSITALLSMCWYLKSIDYFKLSRLACLVYQINNRNNLPLCISDLTIELKYLRDAFSSKSK